MPAGLFFFLAALTVLSALGVILQRNPVHCLLSLVLTLLAIGVLFIGEDATVVGFLQIIVYAGAIMVLFLFVIWLLNLPSESLATGHLALKLFGSLAAAALLAEVVPFVLPARLATTQNATPLGYGAMDSLSQKLFGEYLIAFEVTSLLLLVAVVGSVALASRSPARRTPQGTSAAAAASEPPAGEPA
ncbi:MAG TPA: NADH-quinone oxidoreductase subunit J [Candidatus Binataceae bacterium]|nr:NADH-quinone oxidoreductase subunit J [Candidatus Binataceae bacterium]